MGDIYLTTLSTNPATKYLGTTWEKIEGKFLLATSSSNTSGQTGGGNTKIITKANLPNIKLQVDNFSLTTVAHSHMVRGRYYGAPDGWEDVDSPTHAGYLTVIYGETGIHQKDTFSGGGQNTGTASPYTSALGSGTPLDITPAYYTVHIWKRLS